MNMEPSEYFDRYSPTKPPKPSDTAETAENAGNPEPQEGIESSNPGISENTVVPVSPGMSENADTAGGLPQQLALSSDQLGYGGPRLSRGKNLALAVGKAIGYFAVYFGIQFIVANIFALIWYGPILASAETLEEAERMFNELWNARSMMLMILIDLLVLAAVAVIFVLRRNAPLSARQNRGLKNPVSPGRLALIFGMGITLNYAITIPLGWLIQLLPQSAADAYAETQQVYDANLFVYIISGVILAPIVEELIFRGLISTRLSRAMPAWVAVLISAAGFGALHGTLIQGLYAGLLGILLGMVFFREDSLLASIVLHFGFNLASLLPYILSMNEELMASYTVNALYGAFSMLCMPIGIMLLIFYFMIQKKKAPAEPGAPGVNGWLMRE